MPNSSPASRSRLVKTRSSGLGVSDAAFVVDSNGCRAPADVDESNSLLALLVFQHAGRAGDALEDDIVDLHAGALHTLRKVLDGRNRARDDVHLAVQAPAPHANRVRNGFGALNPVAPRDNMDHLAVGRDCDLARAIEHA